MDVPRKLHVKMAEAFLFDNGTVFEKEGELIRGKSRQKGIFRNRPGTGNPSYSRVVDTGDIYDAAGRDGFAAQHLEARSFGKGKGLVQPGIYLVISNYRILA